MPFKDWNIWQAVRRLNTALANPEADIRDVWLAALHVKYTMLLNGYPRRWRGQADRASRIYSRIKTQTGNRILLWVMFRDVD